MKKLKILLVVIAVILINISLSAQTVDEIIEKHIEALGGTQNIQAVKSMKIVGSVKMMGMEFPFTSYNVTPDKFYFELSVQGKSIKQGYDGTTAWSVNPMGGSSVPEAVEGEEAANIKERSRIFDKLVTFKDDGASVELIGKEQLNNADVYKIQYTGLDGKIITYYLNTSDYMIVKVQKKIKVQGNEVDSETSYSNFKKVNDVAMAYSFEVKAKNSPMGTQEVIIDKIEINQTVEDNIFSMPTK